MQQLLDATGSPLLPVLIAAAAFALAVAVVALPWLYRRPQRGLLLLTALVPFDGLLLLVPHPAIIDGWKEALVLLTVVMSVLAPRQTVPTRRAPPSWVLPAVGLLAVAASSALFVGAARGGLGLKIGFFYLLIPLVLWRHPFSERDRDRWVGILMTTGFLTAVYGLAQQRIGIVGLYELGYEYDTTIRTAGGFLRSFSSFVQPFPFALFLMFVLLVGGTVALDQPRRLRNTAFLLGTPVMLLAMASSIVLNAFLGLLVGLTVLAVAPLPPAWPRPLVGAGVLLLLPARVLSTAISPSSLAERGAGWSEVGDLMLANPSGLGLGTTAPSPRSTPR